MSDETPNEPTIQQERRVPMSDEQLEKFLSLTDEAVQEYEKATNTKLTDEDRETLKQTLLTIESEYNPLMSLILHDIVGDSLAAAAGRAMEALGLLTDEQEEDTPAQDDGDAVEAGRPSIVQPMGRA